MLVGKLLLMACLLAAAFYVVNMLAGEVAIGTASVIDGDTIEIRGTRYRLFGADAFEASQQCQFNGKKWPCGRRAATALSDYIGGVSVTCRPQGNKSYDRIVARCFKGADGDLARHQVQEGWALADERFSRDYVADQDVARAHLKGAWSSFFDAPWTYRQHHEHEQSGR